MTSPRLQILERKLARHTPEKIPAPAEDDLTAAIQRLVDQRVEQAMEERPVKQPVHVQRLLNQQFKPAPVADYRPPTPKPKPTFTTVFHRDGAGRILWSETRADTTGEFFITEVTGRDGTGAIIGLRTIPPAESKDYKPGKRR